MTRVRGIAALRVLCLLSAPLILAQPASSDEVRASLDREASSWVGRPDHLERLDEATVHRLLETVGGFLDGERDPELRAELLYRRAMLRLEPLPTYDSPQAQSDLQQVITLPSEWEPRARYALAWMQEVAGSREVALDGYRRLEIDYPESDVASWGRVGRARLRLREGSYGKAASNLQKALDGGLDESSVKQLRELAVSGLMRSVSAGDPSTTRSFESGVRAPMTMLATPTGGVVLATRRPAAVVRFSKDGARTDEWIVEGLQGATISPRGRLIAAGKETIYRLEAGGRSVPIAALGDFKALGSISAAADGSIWLLDRRGKRLGRLLPGAAAPVLVREDERLRLDQLQVDGRRILALDERSRALLAFEPDGAQRVLFDGAGRRLESLTVDRAGRIAMLDTRNAQIVFILPSGKTEAIANVQTYLETGSALALGPQGELMLHDGKSRWVAIR